MRDQSGTCICPPGSGLDHNGDCINCPAVKGMKVDERGRCVCDLERGMVVDERGNCICPVEFGYVLDRRGYCVKSDQPPPPECVVDSDCADNRYCEQTTNTCQDPCGIKRCGINAFCNATNHRAICQCISGYSGDPEVLCSKSIVIIINQDFSKLIFPIADSTSQFRTDFPRPEMVVSCLSDGVQVEIHITERGFNGMLYVKGHSKDENCRRFVTLDQDTSSKLEIFKVTFGNCGLIHNNVSGVFKTRQCSCAKNTFAVCREKQASCLSSRNIPSWSRTRLKHITSSAFTQLESKT